MKITLKISGKIYESKGETLIEALNNFDLKGLKKISSMAILKVGDKERILNARVANRLISLHGLTKDIAVKQISLMF